MTPFICYQQQIDRGWIQPDPQQQEVINELQNIYTKLLKQHSATHHGFHKLIHPLIVSRPVRGLYLYGSVGVGKTFLMDLFYNCLPIHKIRRHFHEFMQNIHHQLKTLQGEKNPLDIIAKKIAQETRVLCFDEFMVNDIADAIILGNLFKALFANRICLIASANVAPDELYKNGLQREIFLPAIALIKQYTRIFHMISHHDYRLIHLSPAGIYFTPLGQQAELNMEKCFQHFANDQPVSIADIELLGRHVHIHKQAGTTIWFDFTALCDIPRSPHDYLELAKKYKTVMMSNIPIFKPEQHNLMTAFINLIDIFYDARVRVIISAAADVEALYPAGRLRFDFARTQSRLIEMQSTDYFTRNTL